MIYYGTDEIDSALPSCPPVPTVIPTGWQPPGPLGNPPPSPPLIRPPCPLSVRPHCKEAEYNERMHLAVNMAAVSKAPSLAGPSTQPHVAVQPNVTGPAPAHGGNNKTSSDEASQARSSYAPEQGAAPVEAKLPTRYSAACASKELKNGVFVSLHGLRTASLNQQRGFVVDFNKDTGRWHVQINGEIKSFRPENLKVIARPPLEASTAGQQSDYGPTQATRRDAGIGPYHHCGNAETGLSIMDRLKQAKQMLDAGLISTVDYDSLKTKLLASMTADAATGTVLV